MIIFTDGMWPELRFQTPGSATLWWESLNESWLCSWPRSQRTTGTIGVMAIGNITTHTSR